MTVSALLLVGIGLSIVFSATTVPGQHEGLWAKQLVWFGFALLAAWLAAAIHYRLYDTFAYVLYGISILLLVAVLGFGTSAMGAKRWLELGPLKFQPSELAKIATVFVLARRFDDRNLDLRRIKDWLPPLFIMLVPFALVAKEPDLGTSLSFPVILIAMYFWAGMPPGHLLLGLSPAVNVALFFVTGSLLWMHLAIRQMEREAAGKVLGELPQLPAAYAESAHFLGPDGREPLLYPVAEAVYDEDEPEEPLPPSRPRGRSSPRRRLASVPRSAK